MVPGHEFLQLLLNDVLDLLGDPLKLSGELVCVALDGINDLLELVCLLSALHSEATLLDDIGEVGSTTAVPGEDL